jgi:hypothetical protein
MADGDGKVAGGRRARASNGVAAHQAGGVIVRAVLRRALPGAMAVSIPPVFRRPKWARLWTTRLREF